MKPLRGNVRRLVACSLDGIEIYGRRPTRAPNIPRRTRDFMHSWRLCIAIVTVHLTRIGVCFISGLDDVTKLADKVLAIPFCNV